MQTPNERLRHAREKAGFASAAEAAESLGIPYGTYASHENGHRGFPKGRAPAYARKYKVDEQWLLYGKGKGPGASPAITQDDEPVISSEQIESFVDEAFDEILPGMSLGEMKRTASSGVQALLSTWLAEHGIVNISDARRTRAEAARSRAPTTRSAREERRS